MPGKAFSVVVPGGALGGWVSGDGTPVLLLHGGPGLSYDYLDALVPELGEGFEIAAFQQRGLAPSTPEGPFTIDRAIEDVAAVLDALGWGRALVAGHSWGGYLALLLAAERSDLCAAVLAIDPVGLIGDGGVGGFEAEMSARLPTAAAERVREIDRLEKEHQATTELSLEGLELFWPSYFAEPTEAPPMPPVELAMAAYEGLMSEIPKRSAAAAPRLAETAVPVILLAGASSPIPWGQASRATANLAGSIELRVIQGAGHFPWHEVPGCVRDALASLAGHASTR